MNISCYDIYMLIQNTISSGDNYLTSRDVIFTMLIIAPLGTEFDVNTSHHY